MESVTIREARCVGVDLRGQHLPAVYVVFVKEWLDLCLEIRREWF